VKDSSAARNGLLIDHHMVEVNGQNVVGMKVTTTNCSLTATTFVILNDSNQRLLKLNLLT